MRSHHVSISSQVTVPVSSSLLFTTGRVRLHSLDILGPGTCICILLPLWIDVVNIKHCYLSSARVCVLCVCVCV